jgi:hypothetical protein
MPVSSHSSFLYLEGEGERVERNEIAIAVECEGERGREGCERQCE